MGKDPSAKDASVGNNDGGRRFHEPPVAPCVTGHHAMSLRLLFALLGFTAVLAASRAGDRTWTYAVQAHATVQADPARITLRWPTDHEPATGYTVWRKHPADAAWGSGMNLPANATSYQDDNVTVGGVYEYQIEKHSDFVPAWGYVTVGINAPLIESRGKIVLVVDRSIAGGIASELRRLETDLAGDGWGVVRKEVGREDSPAAVRSLIQAEWAADRANVRAVFLLGHVPVVRAGRVNVDGHGGRPLPADGYYGEMDGTWTDSDADGVLDQGTLPSDVELAVGRVDFANLPGVHSAAPFPSEIDLLRRYLEKDHAFRQARYRPTPRALMGNVAGDGRGQAYAASGYRAFAALVGPATVVEANPELTAPAWERWGSLITANDYLWAFAGGAGSNTTLAGLGSHGSYNDLWSTDFLDLHAKGTFYLFFGSWICDWDQPDNLMRAALAAPEAGLAAVWSGRPHYYFHDMGPGQPIGASVRLSQNNDGLVYRNHVMRHPRTVHMALMGDPTLRLTAVSPPSNVRAEGNGSDVTVTWNASSDSVFGYRIYRSATPGAAFERISGELHPETRWVDRPPNPATATYMVRAVTLQLGPSGSYYNPSQGAFSRTDFIVPASAPSGLAAPPPTGRVVGAGSEAGRDIRHRNGNIFDQILLEGTYASAAVDPGQVLRLSFVDPNDDIVQVELAGAGTISIFLADASGPAAPGKYNQAVGYMKGRASIAISGATQATQLSIFSVGRANAVNQSLFRAEPYDGVADIALLTVSSMDGRFGALRAANVRFSAPEGLTGIYASDIAFRDPVLVGDIDAQGSAQPALHLGASSTGSDRSNEVRITGGDLRQSNGRHISVSGLGRLSFEAGTTSHDDFLPAQTNQGQLDLDGVDITAEVVVNPAR